MKISYKGDYALKSLLELALEPGQLVTGHDLARRIDAPGKFLEQVLCELKKGGFIKSRRGSAGGYELARPADQMTIGQVVRYLDGPVEPIACVDENYSGCLERKGCVFQGIWRQVYEAVSGIIDHVTFEELARQVKARRYVPAYAI